MDEVTNAPNELSETSEPTASEATCDCPDSYPNWDGQDIDLGRHCVLTLSIPTFIHMPIAYDLQRKKQRQEVANLELKERWPGFVLTQLGMLRGKMMRLLEDTESPSRHLSYLPRPFNVHAKLHHGDIGTVRKTLGEMQMEMVDKGHLPKELYLGYLTCPLCEERKNGARILIVRRWIESPRLKRLKERRAAKTKAV